MSSLRVERTYPHPRALVWRALTESELLARWLMPNDLVPEVGHRFQFRTDPAPGFDGIVDCQVLELESQACLRISWVGGPLDTEVTFRLFDAPGGTRLVVEQTGFHGVRAWIVARILKLGNRTLYGKRLPQLLQALAEADPQTAPDADIGEPSNCMTREQTFWERLLKPLTK